MVSFGRLGVLGRNGWFCREADVEQLNALAGWRGLKDPAAQQHFNGTFLAFESDGWGPNQQLMTSLNLPFEPVYFGADAAEDAIRARLDASLPAFFYLWSPHAFDSGLSAMQATCAWIRKEENAAVWGAWLPVAKLACDPGNYAVDKSSCAPCPAGSASVGGAVSTCTSCSAGR